MMPKDDTALPIAHLVIRAVGAVAAQRDPSTSPLRRWKAWLAKPRRASSATPEDEGANLSLSVLDLKGRQVFAVERASAVTVVPLPAGTYHVLARTPTAERRYTLALDPKASFELCVRLATQG